MGSDTILARLRRFLFMIAAGVFAMTATELYFLGHWNKPVQYLPFGLCVLGLTALVFSYLHPNRASISFTYGSMILIGVCSFVGFYEHVTNNSRFWLEVYPNANLGELIKAGLTGENPALAPGILLLGAVIGLAAIYQHPELRSK